MSNETQSHSVKNLTCKLYELKYRINDSCTELNQIHDLLSLISLSDNRIMSETDRLYMWENAINGIARLAKKSAENLDLIFDEIDRGVVGSLSLHRDGITDLSDLLNSLGHHDEAALIWNWARANKKSRSQITGLALKLTKDIPIQREAQEAA